MDQQPNTSKSRYRHLMRRRHIPVQQDNAGWAPKWEEMLKDDGNICTIHMYELYEINHLQLN